jgi:ribosomal-protein-alanine N-acetyltransferase
LEKICFGRDAWPWIDLLAALTFPETVPLKAVKDERIVGFVVGDRRRRQEIGWIATIGVHPDHRRMGIGRALLEACERALEMPRVRLSLRRSNEGARRLYTNEGYTVVDRWERYYSDGESATVMEKRLSSPIDGETS